MHSLVSSLRNRLSAAERRVYERFRRRPVKATITVTASLFIALSVVWLVLASYSAYMVRASTNELTGLLDNPGHLEISRGQIDSAERNIRVFKRNIDRLERLTRPPFGEGVVGKIPALGPRFIAARQTLKLGTVLGEAGVTVTTIGRDAYNAFERAGISYDPDNAQESWLQAVDRHRDQMPEIANHLRRTEQLRRTIDAEWLPTFARHRLERLDQFLVHADELAEIAEHYEDFHRAAGGDGTVRYLFLFQNPAELRPAGGFPGTIGVFEFRDGQLVDYEMWDSHILTMDYVAHRTEKLPMPWPWEAYAPQDGFLLHDATWYADFPRSARLMLDMYDETTFPEVNGVIAVQPQAVSDMVRVTGPVEVEVDGEMRIVTEENVYDEVERYRRLRFEGLREGELGDHKDILIDIGEAIMAQLRESGGGDVTEALRLLAASAERRDLQIYVRQPGVQSFLDGRGWSGNLIPEPETPTIALTFTNFVLEKASMAMQPYYDFHLEARENGGYSVVLHIAMQHTGRHDQDHRYYGFQRWWIEAYLPDGSRLIDSSHNVMPDPEAPNGGAYAIDLFPEELEHLTLEFELPDLDRFMIRRQPGQVPPPINIHMRGCESVWAGYLVRDVHVEFEHGCPVVHDPVDEPPQLLMTS